VRSPHSDRSDSMAQERERAAGAAHTSTAVWSSPPGRTARLCIRSSSRGTLRCWSIHHVGIRYVASGIAANR